MLPRLHVITDDAVLARNDVGDVACGIVEAIGRDVALHVRGRSTDARQLFELAKMLRPVARQCGALLVVNDRVDIALAADADAVQLSARSLPPAAVRQIARPEMLIGWSAHTIEDVQHARAQGASFALLGTIWPSPSHPGGPVGGTQLIRSAAGAELPLIAIGGVKQGRIAEAIDAGAFGVAVISAVWNAADPVRSARSLVQEVHSNVKDE